MRRWMSLFIVALTILLLLPVASLAGGEDAPPGYAKGLTAEPTDGHAAIELQDIGTFQGEQGVKPDGLGEKALSPEEEKLSTAILQLLDEQYLPEGVTQGELIAQMEQQGQIAEAPVTNGLPGKTSGYDVYVYIRLKEGSDFNLLAPYVSRIENQDEALELAAAWVDLGALKALSALDEVQGIQEVVAPIVYAGSRMSEGDALLKAGTVRAQTGADGTGVRIGIISDGVGGLAAARSTGDLPANVTVLSDKQGGAEGTAMLEIVHDLAPGAQLYFHDCGSNKLAFNAAITALANAGCTIICDDIGWITEPFFEDGVIAQHIASMLAARDILYVTSGGNDAASHYQGQFYNDGNDWIDFSRGISSNPDLYARVPAGGTIRVVLQWNENFGQSGSDYDLYLFNAVTYSGLALSVMPQDGDDDPLEYLTYTNGTGYDTDVAISVHAYAAPADKVVEIYAYGGSMYANNRVAADSIYGHAAVPGVLCCGAIDYAEPNTIEWFSSQGPVTMLSGARQKPDICGIDGVSVTGAGGFGSPFYGTSAAAPHIAAVAALMRSRFPAMTCAQIRQLLIDNAVDLGSPGYDSVYGYGRSDALSAALSSLYVRFDSRGGSAIQSQLVPAGSKAVKPADPAKAGAIFEGWYREPDCLNEWNFGTGTVTGGDITLYAKWHSGPVAVVTVSANNASYGTVTGGGTYVRGATVTLRATPNAGYRFVRWMEGSGWYSADAVYTFEPPYDTMNLVAEFAPIGVPVIYAASAGYDRLALGWNAVEGAAGYEVWRSASSGGTYTKIGTASGTSYTDAGLATGTTYYYKVKAYCVATTATTYGNLSAYAAAMPAPLAPASPAAASASYSSVRVTWSAVSGASGYRIYRSTAANGAFSYIGTTTSLSYSNGSLKTGTAYYYKVRAYRTVGKAKVEGTESAVVSAKPLLAAVKSASAKALDPVKVKVSWSSVAGRTRYEVWRSENGGAYTLLGTTTGTSYTSAGLTPFKTYTYYVRVYRTVSGQKVYAPTNSPAASATPVLGNVGNVKAKAGSVSSVKLTWSGVSGASGYEVRRWDAAAGKYVVVTSTTRKYYTNTGLVPNIAYTYQVAAYRTVGGVRVYSTPCAPVAATPYFGAVKNVKAAMGSASSVKLTWSGVSGAKGYEVRRWDAAAGKYVVVASTTRKYYTNTGLAPNASYTYQVAAYCVVGGVRVYSAPCTPVSATPVLGGVANAKAVRSTATKIKLTWSAVSGRAGYEIFRSETPDGTFVSVGTTTRTYLNNGGLTTGTPYYYVVRAYVTIGGVRHYGGASAVVTATP